MSNPLVSVLMPVYNVEKFIEEALFSILNQTYKNIEVIVVDDYSTDNTFDICKKISEMDSRVKLFKNPKNLKIVKTLNFALTQSSGGYIARMDGDDISAATRIERQLDFLLNNPEYYLVGSHLITIDEYGKEIGFEEMPITQQLINRTLKLSSPVAHIWLAKREVYNLLNGYREIPGVEDYDFLLRMHTKNLPFTNIDSYDYYVRIRSGNTTSTIGFVQRLMTNYVLYLYKLQKKNIDSYSIDNMKNYIKKNEKFKIKFDKSNSFLLHSIKLKSNKRFLKMSFFLVLACLTSKYQFQYLSKRFFLRIIKKMH